jgi:hypothetical protein
MPNTPCHCPTHEDGKAVRKGVSQKTCLENRSMPSLGIRETCRMIENDIILSISNDAIN